MQAQDQTATLAFLEDPATHGLEAGAVSRIDTHISTVILAGDTVYKLKRAVSFPYLDFSTPERRLYMCEAEVAVNRRTAPDLYLGIAPIQRLAGGTLRLGTPSLDPEHTATEPGTEAVDWVVVMRRFEQENLFDRLAKAGRLTEDHSIALARRLARFHAEAAPRYDHGGSAGISRVLDIAEASFAQAPEVIDSAAADRLVAQGRAALMTLAPLLEDRRHAGQVRHCHGDLHLRNVCLMQGQPILFDAIEFDEDIACIDVLYDLAFLLMDLEEHALPGLASRVLNDYVSHSDSLADTLSGLAALPLFLSCRAAIRSFVNAAAAQGAEEEADRHHKQAEARRYLREAGTYLAPFLSDGGEEAPEAVPSAGDATPEPPSWHFRPKGLRLIAIGGRSGSGKSTLAHALAPALGPMPGAVVLRSDVVRKHLMGVAPDQPLPEEAYRESVTQQVFARLHDLAGLVLATGRVAILDAVYLDPGLRQAAERVAEEAGVPFTGLWLEASRPVLEERVRIRETAPHRDASDAGVHVVGLQYAAEIQDLGWHGLDTEQPWEALLSEAKRQVQGQSL